MVRDWICTRNDQIGRLPERRRARYRISRVTRSRLARASGLSRQSVWNMLNGKSVSTATVNSVLEGTRVVDDELMAPRHQIASAALASRLTALGHAPGVCEHSDCLSFQTRPYFFDYYKNSYYKWLCPIHTPEHKIFQFWA